VQPTDAGALSRRFAVNEGDFVRLVLRGGSVVDGRYRGVRGPTARDPETYLLIEPEAPTRLSDSLEAPQTKLAVTPVPASEISELGVEVIGHGWLIGMLVGLALDAATFGIFAYILGRNYSTD